MYGQGWYGSQPHRLGAGRLDGRPGVSPGHLACGRRIAGLGGRVQPMPYNYGTNITYQDNQVYYGNQPVATADEYYQQAATLAAEAPRPAAESGDWLPLGVFALVQKEQSDPHYVIQLAVNKSGAIAGNYTDLISGTTSPIQGAVDNKTQRVAWTMETTRRLAKPGLQPDQG